MINRSIFLIYRLVFLIYRLIFLPIDWFCPSKQFINRFFDLSIDFHFFKTISLPKPDPLKKSNWIGFIENHKYRSIFIDK
jgi:hypothetical protein